MPKVKVIMEIGVGGTVEIKGVTDMQGRPLSKAACEKAVMEAAAAMGKMDEASLRPVTHTGVKQEQEQQLKQG